MKRFSNQQRRTKARQQANDACMLSGCNIRGYCELRVYGTDGGITVIVRTEGTPGGMCEVEMRNQGA